MATYKLEFHYMDLDYTGEVPCLQVKTLLGDLRQSYPVRTTDYLLISASNGFFRVGYDPNFPSQTSGSLSSSDCFRIFSGGTAIGIGDIRDSCRDVPGSEYQLHAYLFKGCELALKENGGLGIFLSEVVSSPMYFPEDPQTHEVEYECRTCMRPCWCEDCGYECGGKIEAQQS